MTVSLTIKCVYIQQHGALPLVGGPLQLGGGVDADSRRRELQSSQQLVLAQRAVLPRTVVRHVPAEEMQHNVSVFSYMSVFSNIKLE